MTDLSPPPASPPPPAEDSAPADVTTRPAVEPAPAPDTPAPPEPPTPAAADADATDAPAASADAPAQAPEPAPVARVRALTVRLGGDDVLRGVDLDLPAGQVTALLGPNGAGKTTLLRALLGLEGRRAGEVGVLGLDPARDAVGIRRAVGFVPERPALYESMTAVTLGRFVADLYPTWQPRRFIDHLARLGEPPRLRVSELTRSQAARLALAAALGHAPRLLIVDVPHDLDAVGRQELLVGVEDDAAASQRTVLVATSRPHEVERLAGRVVVLAGGEVRFAGSTEDLRARCRRLEVSAAEAPALPAGIRALRWRPPTSRRPGELFVLLAEDRQLDSRLEPSPEPLATIAGAAAHPVSLEEAYLALVAAAPRPSPAA